PEQRGAEDAARETDAPRLPTVLARRQSHRVLRKKRTRGYASVRDGLGWDEHEGSHGWCRGTQHHAAVGSRRPGALFLSDTSDADVSARSRLRRRDARSCPLVLESTAGGSCGSSRALGSLFSG